MPVHITGGSFYQTYTCNIPYNITSNVTLCLWFCCNIIRNLAKQRILSNVPESEIAIFIEFCLNQSYEQ